MCGFIAQLVEHRTGIALVTGSNPVEVLSFSGFFFPYKLENLLRSSLFMHQSIPAVPIPPWATAGICSCCQSWGWGIRNFIAARGLGISEPRGDPRAFDTRVFERLMSLLGRAKPLLKTDLSVRD